MNKLSLKAYFIFVSLLTILLTSAVLASEPLDKGVDGKTNHPVLFVHGRFTTAPNTWGIEWADEPEDKEIDKILKVYIRFTDLGLWGIPRTLGPIIDPQLLGNLISPNLSWIINEGSFLGDIIITDFLPDFFDLEGINPDIITPPEEPVYTPTDEILYYANVHLRQTLWFSYIYMTKDKRIYLVNKFIRVVNKKIADRMSVEEFNNFDLTEYEKVKYTDATVDLPEKEIILSNNSNDEFVVHFENGILVSSNWINKTSFDATLFDLVMKYNKGTVPYVLADELDLDVSYDTRFKFDGINSNGLYFYNAKTKNPDNLDKEGYCHLDEKYIRILTQDTPAGRTFFVRFTVKILKQIGNSLNLEYVGAEVNTMQLGDIYPLNTHCVLTKQCIQDGKMVFSWKIFEDGEHEPIDMGTTEGAESFLQTIATDYNVTIDAADFMQVDASANAYWNELASSYGQPNQLVDKMRYVLSDFYGEGWETNPDAVIDLVGNSMGGTTVRMAIEKARSTDYNNPINHINQIVTTCSPHEGSAFATQYRFLSGTNPSDESFLKLREFRGRIENDGEYDPLTLINITEMGIPINSLGLGYIRARMFLKITGNYLGPYSLDENKVEIYHRIPLTGVWVKIKELKAIEQDNFNKINNTLGAIRPMLVQYGHLAENLGWPEQSGYTDELIRMDYPTIPATGMKIECNHMYVESVDGYLRETFHMLGDVALELMRDWIENSDNEDLEYVNISKFCENLESELENDLAQLEINMSQLDGDWSNRSDLVVETSSQKGINAQFDPGEVEEFDIKTFTTNKKRLAHMNLDISNIPIFNIDIKEKYKLYAASYEGKDISEILLQRTINDEDGRYIKPVFSNEDNQYMVKGKVELSEDNKEANVILSLSNNQDITLNGVLMEYYFKANPDLEPKIDVVSSGGDNITLVHIGGYWHKVIIENSDAVVLPGEDYPYAGTIDFTLYYDNSSVEWEINDDWSSQGIVIEENIYTSCPVWDNLTVYNTGDQVCYNEQGYEVNQNVYNISGDVFRPDGPFSHFWQGTDACTCTVEAVPDELYEAKYITVEDGNGVRYSGLKPVIDTVEHSPFFNVDPKPFKAYVKSLDRSQWPNVSQPSLSVVNSGEKTISGFNLYYYFSTEKEPQLRIYWMNQMDKAETQIIQLTGNSYAVKISYEDVNIAPGEAFDFIDFEINNTDWSTWDFDNDFSYIDAEKLTLNPKIHLYSSEGTYISGNEPEIQ